jgi:hypothetical protein
MKKFLVAVTSVLVVVTLVLGASAVMAAKPLDVILRSNGFPSGQHFNLNLHGRDCLTWTGEPTGNSIIIPLYSSDCGEDATIQYISNKKNWRDTELVVIDPLTEPFSNDHSPAEVYLPYNILDESDNTTKSAGGYYVIGRILGKPGNGSSGNESSIILSQNVVLQTTNFTDNNTYPFPPDDNLDDLLTVGLIDSKGNLYSANATHFKRFDPPTDDLNQRGKGKKTGKSMGVEITELLKWTGFVADNATYPDNNGNGMIDFDDLYSSPTDNWSDWDIYPPYGEITLEEFRLWAESYGAVYYEGAWIFDIADLVISGQTVINDGTKNFQIRFYPVETTLYFE